MSVVKLEPVTGAGTPVDRSAELCRAIKETCYRVGLGMPTAAVVGCLEIAKIEIIQEQSE
jgi:hypothetical protein